MRLILITALWMALGGSPAMAGMSEARPWYEEQGRGTSEPRRWWFPLIGVHFYRGGDTMLWAITESCDENEENCTDRGLQRLDAGEGVELEAGVVLAPLEVDGHAIDLQASAGFKLALMGGYNGNLAFRRIPLEVLIFYRYAFPEGDWHIRLGAGAAWHVGVGIGCSGETEYFFPAECDGSLTWASTPGWVAAAGVVRKDGAVSLRYGRLEYRVHDTAGATHIFSGNYFGVALQWLIGMSSR